MECPNCQVESPEGAKYCANCGQALTGDIPCPNCSESNPADSKFCNNCGQSLKKKQGSRGRRITLMSLPVAAVIFVFCFYFWRSIGTSGGAEQFPIAFFIIISAIVGAMVNQSFRSRDGKDDVKNLSFGWFIGFVVWKCLVAIAFAFLLYLMFIGSLVSGDLFPKFIHTSADAGGQYTTMMNFATEVEPASFMDLAKLLVWSFIAGYSERFVPNLVSNISPNQPSA